MVNRSWLCRIMALALVIAVSGCGGKNKPVKVSGIVTLDGVPLPGVKVSYVSVSGEGRPAWGFTDDNGKFDLTTITTKDGAFPGLYNVTIIEVQKDADEAAVAIDPKDPQAVIEYQAKMAQKQRDQGPVKAASSKSPIHLNYTRLDKTPLREKVPPDGPVEIKLSKSGI